MPASPDREAAVGLTAPQLRARVLAELEAAEPCPACGGSGWDEHPADLWKSTPCRPCLGTGRELHPGGAA